MPSTTLFMQKASSIRKPWLNKTFLPKITYTTNTTLTSTLDGAPVELYYDGITVNSGVTLTTSNRCKGLHIFCRGDLVVNGVINMSARGARATGTNRGLKLKTLEMLHQTDVSTCDIQWLSTSAGAGGTWYTHGYAAATNTGLCGGGGNGGGIGNAGGNGSAGTIYSGGSGGGASGWECAWRGWPASSCSGSAGVANGGAGGNGNDAGSGTAGANACGGGAGNPGGSPYSGPMGTGYTGSSGTGGALIFVVYGNIIIGSTGAIISDGSPGGSACGGHRSAGGGGSGGGGITLLYTGNYTNSGTIRANGGSGGASSCNSQGYNWYFTGGNGGAGNIRVQKVVI
jgi:hypothetical protein